MGGSDPSLTNSSPSPNGTSPGPSTVTLSDGDAPPRKSAKRASSRSTYVAVIVAVIVIVSAVAYEAYSSGAPGNPCASFTPEQLGANATPGQVTGDTTPNYAAGTTTNGAVAQVPNGTKIQVVAAENFWGSLVSQLGGNLTSVTSIVTDPNTDPHEYEANATDATLISNANLVIVNGVGYDDWATQLVAASDSPGQETINVGDLNGVSVTGGIVTGNPHQWYNPIYVNHTLIAMYADLVALQPSSTAIFQQNFANLNSSTGGGAQGVSLDQLYARANQIKAEFAGTVVLSTESIFVYLANYTGLDLIAPQSFMEAIAEGNDPPTQSVAEFQCQIEAGHVRVLVYNIQTVTTITTNMEHLAAQFNISVTSVSETIQPSDDSFQNWMYAEYGYLENALDANQLGQ
jgi:zinc/manganese transport system substrate-binding protein